MTKTNETADTRTMATDAVATIGMLIPEHAGRDAIHLAVEPVVAGERLAPGQHIGFLADGTVGTKATELLGIVDPFLAAALFPGDRFWLVVYPRTITSLRHVWAHPAFAPVEIGLVAQQQTPSTFDPKEESRVWLEDFAKRLFSYAPDDEYGPPLEQLISGLEYGGSFGTDIEYDMKPTDELYMHYERYTGKPAPARPKYFRCAC